MDALTRFQTDHKTHLEWNNGNIRLWHTDNGGEFTSSSLNDFCNLLSIRRRYSTPWVPQQNAYAERSWGALLRTMRIMLAESKVPEAFWPYAMDTAALLHNTLPCYTNPGMKTPWEMLYGVAPDLSKIRVWGVRCFYLVPERDRESKLSPKASFPRKLWPQCIWVEIHAGMDT